MSFTSFNSAGGLVLVAAVGCLSLFGCANDRAGGSAGAGGSGAAGGSGPGGMGGIGGAGGMGGAGRVFACTAQGVTDAIAEGGGPHTFTCDGPTTVSTTGSIAIDNDVELDGEGELLLEGDGENAIFDVAEGVTATLSGFGVSAGSSGIVNGGTLTVTLSTISGNQGCGIYNLSTGTMTIIESTIADNEGTCFENNYGGGIVTLGALTVRRSTIAGNLSINNANLRAAGGLFAAREPGSDVEVLVFNSTFSENGSGIQNRDSLPAEVEGAPIRLTHCTIFEPNSSNRFSVDARNTIFILEDDPGMTAMLIEPLADNGGPTQTHALALRSRHIDAAPACSVDVDQRGVARPQRETCDNGAFEAEPCSCDVSEGCDLGCNCDLSCPPPSWSCPPARFSDGVGCDCGCSAPDPDCGNGGCTEPGCSAFLCDFCFAPGGIPTAC